MTRRTKLRPSEGGKMHTTPVTAHGTPTPAAVEAIREVTSTAGDCVLRVPQHPPLPDDVAALKLIVLAQRGRIRRDALEEYRAAFAATHLADQLNEAEREIQDLSAQVRASGPDPARLLKSWAADRGLTVDDSYTDMTYVLIDDQGREALKVALQALYARDWSEVTTRLEALLVDEGKRPPARGRDAIGREFVWLVTELGIEPREWEGFTFDHIRELLREKIRKMNTRAKRAEQQEIHK